jgi:signal transduction histidine kinase
MRERLTVEEEKARMYQDISNYLQEELKEKLASIQQQKEEIEAQNEELLQQSTQLLEQREHIEKQLHEIKRLNAELEQRVAARTAELEASNERLLRYTRQVEDYAFALAHNLRAPLARIMGLAQLIEMKSEEQGGAAADVSVDTLIQSIVKSAYEADEVLHDLNEIVAIREQGIVNMQLVSMPELVHEVIQYLQTIYTVPFSFKEDYRTSLVFANREYLREVLISILDNSFRFRNSVRELHIVVRVFQSSAEYYAIEIEDNGLGLDVANFRAKLFHPYQVFHVQSGRGIGLYMAHVKVEAMGGSIEIDGKPNEGLQVRILLPIKK